jgi:PAS domain S-box-containing protein
MVKARSSGRKGDEWNAIRRQAMEFAGIGIYSYTFDGAVLFMDRGTLKILEIEDRFPDPNTVTGKKLSELLVYTVPEGLMRKEIHRLGHIHGREWTFRTLGGREKWAVEDSYLVTEARTGKESIQVLIRDVTDRKRMEAALGDREQQYRMTLDAMADAIHLVDSDLRIVIFNRAFRKLAEELDLGTDVIGRNVFEVFPFLPAEIRAEYEHVLATGQILATEETTRIGDREFITETCKIPILEQGNVVGVLTIIHDATERKRAEEALRQSEAKYRTLVEVFPLALSIFQDRKVVFINEATRRMFRYDRIDDIIGQDIMSMVSDREKDRLATYVRDRLSGKPGAPDRYEAVLRRADGEEFPADVIVQMITLGGKPAQQVLVADMTERKRAEEALRQSEEKYRNILESIQEGYYEVDLAGNFTFFNPALCRILGYSEQEMRGMNYRQYYGDAATIAKVYETYNRVYRTGQDVQVSDWEVTRKDGTKPELGISISLIRDEQGRPVGFRGIVRDITQRKRTEQALQESEERYRELFANANDIVYTHDLSGTFTSLNKAGERISGYTQEEILSRNILDIVAPEYHSLATDMVRRKLAGEEPTRYELAIVAKAGHLIPIEVSTRLIHKAGNPIGIQGIARDITERKRGEEERKRLEAQIQHAQKLEGLGVLAGGIAHDFNNLLVGMMGYAGLALTKLPPDSPARGYVQKIETSAQRAAELTNQMLAYSGRGTFMVRPINLSELAREMGHLFEASISKKATLKYRCAPDLPFICGDAAQIHQVIMNLITNASDALGDNPGVITLSTRCIEAPRELLAKTYLDDDLPAGPYVCLEVSDTGCGMDANTQARIFDPFFTTKFAGRGLGLAAVLGIVRGHRGAIKVYSEPGRGSTFRVLFPAAAYGEKDAVVGQGADQEKGPDLWRGQGVILVVDDEEGARAVAKEILEHYGFTVLTAVNGREAVELFHARAQDIAAVLLDLTMPVMGGEKAFEQMHSLRPGVPIVLSSGYTEQDAAERFTGGTPAAFIQKPYVLAEFAAKFRAVLEAR